MLVADKNKTGITTLIEKIINCNDDTLISLNKKELFALLNKLQNKIVDINLTTPYIRLNMSSTYTLTLDRMDIGEQMIYLDQFNKFNLYIDNNKIIVNLFDMNTKGIAPMMMVAFDNDVLEIY